MTPRKPCLFYRISRQEGALDHGSEGGTCHQSQQHVEGLGRKKLVVGSFGHLEGVPQPDPYGTKPITMGQ